MKLSDKLMSHIANALSHKITFILFCIIAFVPLFYQRPDNILAWDQYISQTVVQLIALNVLGNVAKLEGAKTERVLNETHDLAMSELSILKEELEIAKIQRTNSDIQRTEIKLILDELKIIMTEK